MNPVSSRPTNHMLIVPLLGLTILLALCSGSALASETGVVKFFGGKGTEGGKFGSLGFGQGLAINQTGAGGAGPGDVYVVDPDNHRIQQFSASGDFIRAFGLGVGGSGADVCTVASACVAGENSSAAGGLPTPYDVSVDPSTGVLYSADLSNSAGADSANRIDVFSAAGQFEGAFGWNVKVAGGAEELQFCTDESGCKAGTVGNGQGQFRAGEGTASAPIAVSPLNGHVFFADRGNSRVQEFAPNIEEGRVTGISFVRSYGGGPESVTVDQSGKIYLLQYKKITTYSSAGSPEGTLFEFDEFHSGGSSLEINSLNGNVLVNWGINVPEFTPSGELIATYLEGAGANGTPFISDIALNQQSGTIYLTSSKPESGVLVLGEPVPPTVSVEAVSTFTGTTATFKGHVNPKGFFANYHFEYSADGVKWTALPNKELPADSQDHAVSQEATGLVGHTHYQVRLVAEKSLGGGTASAETTFETAAAAPVVSAIGVEDITDTTAKPTAKLNSENEETSYHFECVSQAQFEASGYAEAVEAPSGGASLAASGETVQVSTQLTGLSSTTAYRCRLAASNLTGPGASPEATFTTFASQPLGPPDGRAYEQATPVGKNGSDARGKSYVLRAAPDGEAASYLINGGGATEGGGAQHLGIYSALRGGSSWGSHVLWPSASFGNYAQIVGWSRDLRRDYVVAYFSQGPLTLYEQDLETGSMTTMATGVSYGKTVFAAEAADSSVVLIESKDALATGATAGWSNLYLWNRNTHKLSLVDIGPSGTPPFHGAFAGPYDWVGKEPKVGGVSIDAGYGSYYTQQLHALSEDGSTLFFTSYNVAQLYARTGLDTASPKTVQVSASQKTNGSGTGGKDPKGPQKAAFMEATPDGRYVFFTSSEELTNDATTGSADQGNDLYRYDTQTGELIDIAPDTTDANGAEVQGVIGSSADGSSVYFAANGVLAAGASAGNCTKTSGTCSVYLWHEGQISFIAPTGGNMISQGGEGLSWMPTTAFYPSGVLAMRTGRVSANGTLLFLSSLSPTSYDSEGKGEAYRYEPGAGLRCVSCNPTGAPPVGDAGWQDIDSGGSTPVVLPEAVWVRNLSANGKRVFFETPDQLVASDINHQQDVYEWEAKGEGGCQSEAQNGGCIYLISSGESNGPSYFADASENGDDVFFFTRQSLVRQDTDQLQDVYDARVDGGIASQNEAPPPQCEGEACKGPAPQAPGAQSAGSTTFSGPANPAPNRKKHKKKRHAKKHHKSKAKHASKGRAGR